MVTVLLLLVALAFAMNIGASGAAASMGEVYGGGALRKRAALVLVALFVIPGAVLAGGEVVHTIGTGIIGGGQAMTLEVALVVLLAALVPLVVANLLGIPLSTSEVTVGALVGAGLALGGLNTNKVGIIVLSWAIIPFLAFLIAMLIHRFVGHPLEHFLEERQWPWLRRLLTVLLIVGGCYTAFSAGSNNAANAFGPLVGAGVLSTSSGLLLGGLFMGVGAVALGSRVLETNGRRITKLTLPAGITVDFTAASLVLAMSLVGFPVPLTQATTGAIVGVGYTHRGVAVLRRDIVKKVASVWLLSPAVSMLLAFFLLTFLQGLGDNFTSLTIVLVTTGPLIVAALLVRGGGKALRRGWVTLGTAVATMGVQKPKAAGYSRLESELERELVGALARHSHSSDGDGDGD